MLFAEFGAEGYAVVIGAVFLGLTQLWSMWLSYKRELAKIARDELAAAKVEEVRVAAVDLKDHQEAARVEAAVKAEEVKADLKADTVKQNEHLSQQDAKLDAVTEKVEIVHRATNSIVSQLVEKTEAEALSRGGVDERARADAEKKAEGKS